MIRKRDTLLASLEYFRADGHHLVLNNLITFLYVAENSGITIKDMARLAQLSLPTASRAVRPFIDTGRPDPWRMSGLVGLAESPDDGRSRLLFLTDKGRAVVAKLDSFIREARPINPPPSESD